MGGTWKNQRATEKFTPKKASIIVGDFNAVTYSVRKTKEDIRTQNSLKMAEVYKVSFFFGPMMLTVQCITWNWQNVEEKEAHFQVGSCLREEKK